MSGSGRSDLVSRRSTSTFTDSSPVLVRVSVPCAPTMSPTSQPLNASYTSPSTFACRNSWMRPDSSWICTKLALPITRLSRMRPAIATRWPLASSASAVQVSASANCVCRSPAYWSRRKSFGKAMPPSPRSAVSWRDARRSGSSRRRAWRWRASGRSSVGKIGRNGAEVFGDGVRRAIIPSTAGPQCLGSRVQMQKSLDARFRGHGDLGRIGAIRPRRRVSNRPPGRISGSPRRIRPGRHQGPSACRCVRYPCADP